MSILCYVNLINVVLIFMVSGFTTTIKQLVNGINILHIVLTRDLL